MFDFIPVERKDLVYCITILYMYVCNVRCVCSFTAEAVRQLAGATVYLDDTSSNVTYQMRDLAINVFKDVVKVCPW